MATVTTLNSTLLKCATTCKLVSRSLIASLPGRLDGGPLNINYEVSGGGDHSVLLLPGALGSTKTDFGPQLELMKDDHDLGATDSLGRQTEASPAVGISSPRMRTTPSLS